MRKESELTSRMLHEARHASVHVEEQLTQDRSEYQAVAASLRTEPPSAMLTLARGSSDHAAQYFAYLVMMRLGQLVTSLPMSLITLYGSAIRSQGLVALAYSQSGQSPDLVLPTQQFRSRGARTVAFVNDAASPLAMAAAHVLPLRAGPERSIAATKSYIAQLVASARLVAEWQGDPALRAALTQLPQALHRAAGLSWDHAIEQFAAVDRLYVIGRGTGLAIACEAALKFKEVCGIQAEAFSGAEVRHGPMALVGAGYPVLILAPRGPAQSGLIELARDLRQRGAIVLLAAPGVSAADLPLLDSVTAEHEDLDPISLIQSFYPMVEALARARGRDPDRPPFLSKITRTQ